MVQGTNDDRAADDPEDGPAADDAGSGGAAADPLEALEQGRVDPRLLRPDPGESRQQFEARLLATVLGLDTETVRQVRSDDGGDGGGDPDGSDT